MIFLLLFFALSSLFAEPLLPPASEVIYQESGIAIFENPVFGRGFSVDGMIKTEKDEAMFHEMFVHPALLTHGKALRVLILGGFDGGVLREVIRHKEVEKITLVEPREALKEIAKKYFPKLADRAFEDARLSIVSQKMTEYFQGTEDVFDVILCDLQCDKVLYDGCKKHLSSDGILIHPVQSPFLEEGSLKQCSMADKEFFDHRAFYMASIPSLVGGPALFAWMSPVKHRMTIAALKKRMKSVSGQMRYYTPSLQKAAFQIPSYLQKISQAK